MHKADLKERFYITSADFFVLAILLIFFSSAFIFQSLHTEKAAYFIVNANGKEFILYPDQEKVLTVVSNGFKYRIVVENKSIYVAEANCPDKQCVKMGKISSAGERIICLPGRLIITAKGKENYDAVNR